MDYPQNDFLLLSLVNTYLRDSGFDLYELCADKGWEKEVVTARLAAIGYFYKESKNAFTADGRNL